MRPGDRVEIVATGGPVLPARLGAARRLLTSWGLRVTVGRHVLARHPRLPHLAGTDHQRAGDLRRAWTDPGVAAVVCARGGYGTTRLLPEVDLGALARERAAAGGGLGPWLVGSSDVTALHAAVAASLGLVTLLAPMPASVALDSDRPAVDATRESLRRALLEPARSTLLQVPSAAAVVRGRADGTTVGGTLSILASLAGTGALPNARGSVVLLEDIDESAYRVDRLLTQLLATGWLDGVAGVCCGSWERCGPGVGDVIADRLAPLGVPLVTGLPFGHGTPARTVPLGARAVLDVDADAATLVVQGHPRAPMG